MRHDYDAFLSLAGPDRPRAEVLVQALAKRGIEVFLDDRSIEHFTGITASIRDALSRSRVLIAYYSRAFAERDACQFELTAAFIAAIRAGQPTERILVVNPETGYDHIRPATLADARYATVAAPTTDAELDRVADLIAARVRAVRGTLGDLPPGAAPRWYGRSVPGSAGFVGRYRELWDLDSALRAIDYPLTQEVTAAPAVLLVGVPGIGKSALAAAYAWQFGPAYPGGIFWLDLAGATAPDEVLGVYASELRRICALRFPDLPVSSWDDATVLARLAAAVTAAARRCLWIVDDVPPELPPDLLTQLPLPAAHLHTLLITQHNGTQDTLPLLRLDGLRPPDAARLLSRYRDPGTDETECQALGRIVARLGGHSLSIQLVGRHLRHRTGLVTLADEAARLDRNPGRLDALADLHNQLDATQLAILRAARLCAPAPLPVELLARAFTTGPGAQASAAGPVPRDLSAQELGDALTGLAGLALASELDGRWQVQAVVADALPADPGERDLAALLAASALDLFAAGDAFSAGGTADAFGGGGAASAFGGVVDTLLAPAARLLDHLDERDPVTQALLRQVARHYRVRGAAAMAIRYYECVLTSEPNSTADRCAAATTAHAAGQHERAIGHAHQALAQLDPGRDPELVLEAELALAGSLDVLGRRTDAEPHWTAVIDTATSLDNASAIGARLAHVRSRRVRGALPEARQLIDALLASASRPAGTAGLFQEARLELARIQLSTTQQREARQTAAAVEQHYRDRGQPDHPLAVTARTVLAEARLSLDLWDLHVDKLALTTSLLELEREAADLRTANGILDTATLEAELQVGRALVTTGKSDRAIAHLTELRPWLSRRLGPDHPWIYLTDLFHSQALMQQKRWQAARELVEPTFAALRRLLGPQHPETLRAEAELGATLLLTDDRPGARAAFAEVRRLLPRSVGRGVDNWFAVLIGEVYTFVPSWLLRLLAGNRP